MKNLFEMHPPPWTVKYDPAYDEWDPRSRPTVSDANGNLVIWPRQYVAHPGIYDRTADAMAHLIAAIPMLWDIVKRTVDADDVVKKITAALQNDIATDGDG